MPPLPKPFFALAPMDDVTESSFRRVVHNCAPADLYFTEFVNVDGLQSPGRPKLLKKLKFNEVDGPLIAQIWGLNPENFRLTAEQIADGSLARELGLPEGVNFTGLDLNMGCPAKSEVSNGACSALIKNRPLAHELINAAKDGLKGRLPLSVKTRVGFNEVDMTWISFLLEHELHMLTVHGRTRKEMSKVPANWDLIGKARWLRDQSGKDTLIVGNGDVRDRQHGIELAERYGLDGIMIGRGIFHDPYAFAEQNPWHSFTPAQRINQFNEHVQIFNETWQPGERNILSLNKFCKVYINGFDGAKELRDELMHCADIQDLQVKIKQAAQTYAERPVIETA